MPDGTNTANGTAPAPVKYGEIVSEGVRSDAAYKGFLEKFGDKAPDDVAKAYLNLEHLAHGKTDGMVRVPGADASAEEVAAYRKAVGVPAKPEEYALPEVQGVEYDQSRVQTFFQEAHRLGLTPTQAQGVVALEIARQQQFEKEYQAEWEKAYRDEKAKAAALEAGKRVLVRIAEKKPELAKRLEGPLSADVHFLQAMEVVAGYLQEGQSLTPEERAIQVKSVEDQIKELRGTPAFISGNKSALAQYQKLLEKVIAANKK